MNLTDLSEIRRLCGKYGFEFDKSYGQNFLINPAVPARIAEICGVTQDEGVIEIGPGFGTLTRCLAPRAAVVCAVELDRTLEPVLGETLEDLENVRMVWGDVLKTDLGQICREMLPGLPVRVCANLPYYITTPAILHILRSPQRFESITVMIQSEVADKLCAAPGSANYNAVTAMCSFYARAEKCFTVAAGSFYPPPKVESTVLRLIPYPAPPVEVPSEELLMDVIQAAFAQRRKTLLNALSMRYASALGKAGVLEAIHSAGLSPDIRGERLSVKEFAALTCAIAEMQSQK